MKRPAWANGLVRVQFPALSELSYTYSTPEEAILSINSRPRQARARRDAARIRGRRIEAIEWFEMQTLFHLSGGHTLRIYLRDEFTEWEILPMPEIAPDSPGFSLDTPAIPLRHVGSAGECDAEWKAGALLSARVGREVGDIALCAGWVWLSVYVCGRQTLTFHAGERCDDGGRFLCWFEDD